MYMYIYAHTCTYTQILNSIFLYKSAVDVITSPSETKAYYEKEIEDFCPVDTKYISLVGEGSVVDLVSNKVL